MRPFLRKGFALILLFLFADLILRLGFWAVDKYLYPSTIVQHLPKKMERNFLRIARTPEERTFISALCREVDLASAGHYHPYFGWQTTPFRGKYVNIGEHGIRATWVSPEAKEDAYTIYCFGGSTMLGPCRDEYTIPSLLAKTLYAAGYRNVRVKNFGSGGYTFGQEVMQLVQVLKAGEVPDYVIFYDGNNDLVSISVPGAEPGSVMFLGLLREKYARKEGDWMAYGRQFAHELFIRQSGWRRFFSLARVAVSNIRGRNRDPVDFRRAEEMASAVTDMYVQNARLVEKLSQAYGFKYTLFWQPVAPFQKPLTERERANIGDMPRFMAAIFESGYLQAAALSGKVRNFRDISGTFRDTRDDRYIDVCHVNEEGNRQIAETMFAHIRGDLESGMVPAPLQ